MNRTEALARRNQARERLRLVVDMMGASPDEPVLQAALEEMLSISEADQGFTEARWHAASLLEAMGEVDAACQQYAIAVTIDPEVGGEAAAAASLYGRLGQLLEMRGEVDLAVRYYNRFLGYYPRSDEAAHFQKRIQMLAMCGGDWLESLRHAADAQAAERHEEALPLLDTAVACYPGAAFLHKLRGLSLRKIGRYDEALRAFEEAGERDADARIVMETGITYGELGNPMVEEGFFQRVVLDSPLDGLATFNMGLAFFGRRDRGQALEFLERAVELAPEAGWADRAVELMSELVRGGATGVPACLMAPLSWKVWRSETEGLAIEYPAGAYLDRLEAGELFACTDSEESAIFEARLRRIVTEEGFDSDEHMRILEARFKRKEDVKTESVQRLRSGAFVLHMWELREIKRDVMEIFVTFCRDEDVYELRVRAPWEVYRRVRESLQHMVKSLDILVGPSLLAARRRLYEQRVAQRPDDIESLADLGATLLKQNDLATAQQVYTKLVRLDGRNPRVLGDLGLLYWQQDKLDLAIKALTQALEARPDARYTRYLGLCHERKGRPERAAKVYEEALGFAPDDALRLRWAVALEALRKYDQAEEEYKRLVASDPLNIRAHLHLGALYRGTKRLTEALSSYREATLIDGRNVHAHLMLGTCSFEMRYWDVAEKAYRRVLTLDPHNETAQDGLATLAVEKKKKQKY